MRSKYAHVVSTQAAIECLASMKDVVGGRESEER
jgi:hypothetical protein